MVLFINMDGIQIIKFYKKKNLIIFNLTQHLKLFLITYTRMNNYMKIY